MPLNLFLFIKVPEILKQNSVLLKSCDDRPFSDLAHSCGLRIAKDSSHCPGLCGRDVSLF